MRQVMRGMVCGAALVALHGSILWAAPVAPRRVHAPLVGERTSRVAPHEAASAAAARVDSAGAPSRQPAKPSQRTEGADAARAAKSAGLRATGSAKASRNVGGRAMTQRNGVGPVAELRRPESTGQVEPVPQRTRTITNRTGAVK